MKYFTAAAPKCFGAAAVLCYTGNRQKITTKSAAFRICLTAGFLGRGADVKKILKFLFSRLVIFSLLIALQLFLLIFLLIKFSEGTIFIQLALEIISLAAVIWLVNKKDNPSYKIAWVIVVLAFPLLGGVFYLMWGNKGVHGKTAKKISNYYQLMKTQSVHAPEITEEAAQLKESHRRMINYVARTSGFSIFKNTQVEYFPLGEDKFVRLQEELKKAKRFIFMEYFIVQEGKMWDPIFEILKEKVKEGVDVRFMYDDLGCIQTMPSNYYMVLAAAGIKVSVFNPFRPQFNMQMNYRDHRKICVIDGNVGFTGGINLADEYINAYPKHGHWKDTAVMLTGDAVWSLTQMFLQLWEFNCGEEKDRSLFKPTVSPPSDGYVQPFGDSPMDYDNVAENAYLQIINTASRYVYITTPYLILDNEMVTALTIAAKSGIDVRIITPHIADKWFVHIVTQSYYRQLLEEGVRIYEYTPGFIHAKMFVSDDDVAIVGTTNMDFRSFYLHFECGVAFYNASVIPKVKEDIENTLTISQEITLETIKSFPLHRRIAAAFLKMFAPLM